MKRIIAIILSLTFLVGCEMLDVSNTPTKKVEEYLNKFQINDESVLRELDSVIDSKMNIDDENKKTYREIIKKQYKDMQYTIKDESRDGDEAVVTASIIVKDFTKVISEALVYKSNHATDFYLDGVYNDNLYQKYLLDKLKDAKDKVTYTLDFTLHNKNGKWALDPISSEIEDKILGIYNYEN